MQPHQLRLDGLPPEIWQHVLEHLPKPDQRTCRLVCPALHRLVTGMVFARVVVNFGDWDTWNAFDEEMGMVIINPEQAERSIKFLGFLDRVVDDVWFAGMVKVLEVHAFGVGVETTWSTTSFLFHLSAAVRTLLSALSTSCPFLHVLSLPMQSLRDLPLTAFRRLHTISVTSAEYTANQIEHELSAGRCTTLLPSLHTLQLPYSVPTDIPISCLPNLTRLEIVPHLQSLALFSPVHDQEHIFAELADAKADVPHLRALALQGPSPHVTVVRPAELAQLCDFLRAARRSAGYLDLRMESQPFDRALSALKLTSGTPLSVQDAIRGARKLELVGFNGHFHDVQYARIGEGEPAEPLARPPWPPRKTALRGVEDFGCEGWEWLMRHLTIVP
ncbi:uncharacterized protein B0H18DRAFT_1015951 [Fomitopsis serialis]|uniref:uncharacterized protein n=1 Tax=Fomitopsis serialis TaxID=139415 RepID=UPI002008B948|nr:uncharacterized protein B0H18DRAFT_1015951 [Neoantrodia serialis]KAH9923059.1 hypothetical protein B0H18DRAFT_1015951 [Neoantrodia serialis]